MKNKILKTDSEELKPDWRSSDKILRTKIQKSLEIICLLYNNDLITDSYIVGSIVEGTATQYSDIDINIINPLFEIHPSFPAYILRPVIIKAPNIKKVVDQLKEIGIKFKFIKRKDLELWYEIYRNELFHIILNKDEKSTIKPRIHITRDICQLEKSI